MLFIIFVNKNKILKKRWNWILNWLLYRWCWIPVLNPILVECYFDPTNTENNWQKATDWYVFSLCVCWNKLHTSNLLLIAIFSISSKNIPKFFFKSHSRLRWNTIEEQLCFGDSNHLSLPTRSSHLLCEKAERICCRRQKFIFQLFYEYAPIKLRTFFFVFQIMGTIFPLPGRSEAIKTL